MHYLILLYGDESTSPAPGTPESDADMAGYLAFGELAATAIRGGAALHLTNAARTVRHDGGAVTVTDGPFAETAEALGGYYIVEAGNLDDVIELVRHLPVPAAPGGGSEIRPLVMAETFVADPDWSMAHLATLHRDEDETEEPGSKEWDQGAAEHGAFMEANREALIACGALRPSTAATTVRVRDGEVAVTDGPFSEVIEVVGGFYVLSGTPAEVEAVARQIPMGDDGAAFSSSSFPDRRERRPSSRSSCSKTDAVRRDCRGCG